MMELSAVQDILRKSGALLEEYSVEALYVFGSVARGTATDSSDIDLMVEFGKPISLIQLIRLRNELSRLLGRRVDIVTPDALHPALSKRIMKERVRAA